MNIPDLIPDVKFDLIRARSAVLKQHFKCFEPSKNLFYRFFTCRPNINLPYLRIPFFNGKNQNDFFKLFKKFKFQDWSYEATILVEDAFCSLDILIDLAEDNFVTFYKKSGDDDDFINLISEVIEFMKYLKPGIK